MTSQVIDTSALVKYVLPEEDSPVVEKLVAYHRAGIANLMAPAYILVESANVLWKQIQRQNVQPEDAVPSLRALRNLGIRLVPDADLLEDALLYLRRTTASRCTTRCSAPWPPAKTFSSSPQTAL